MARGIDDEIPGRLALSRFDFQQLKLPLWSSNFEDGDAVMPAIGAVYESAGEIDNQPVSPVHEYIFQFEQVL